MRAPHLQRLLNVVFGAPYLKRTLTAMLSVGEDPILVALLAVFFFFWEE